MCAAALLVLAGCDQQTALPTAPGATAGPSQTGQLDIALFSPGGNVLMCTPAEGWCNTVLVVDVQLDRDVLEPWVTASIYNGSQRCGGTTPVRDSESIDPLRANTVTRLTTVGLYLSANQNGTFCTAMTKMVVQVWADRGRSPAPLLTREFPDNRTIIFGSPFE
jgi:hypothetical protein